MAVRAAAAPGGGSSLTAWKQFSRERNANSRTAHGRSRDVDLKTPYGPPPEAVRVRRIFDSNSLRPPLRQANDHPIRTLASGK